MTASDNSGATGIESKAYRNRPARREDIGEIVRLYNLVTGKDRTDAQHTWEWYETPDGPGSTWVIEEAATGVIVGHHGLIPVPMRVGGQRVLAGKTENTMVHPNHRGKVLYFLHERQFAQAAEARFDLLFTTSGYGGPGRIRRKLGYASAGTTTFFLKVTRATSLQRLTAPVAQKLTKSPAANRLLALAVHAASAPAVLAFGGQPKPAKDVVVTRCRTLQEIVDEVEALWVRTAPAVGISVERSAAYLQWRLGSNPNVEHAYFGARRNGELVGFAAVELMDEGQALIVDLLAEGNQPPVFDSLVQGTLRELDREGNSAFVVPALQGSTALAHGLQRNGFHDLSPVLQRLYRRANREQPHLLVKAIRPELAEQGLLDASRWYYTALFAEGLRTEGIGLRAPKRDEAA
jgi:hypothetical protein